MKLAVIILTFNEENTIVECVKSVQFADRVIVFDSFSTDNTVNKAHSAGAEIIQNGFENYAQQRNTALARLRDSVDWVLFVDADERITPELAAEIREKIEQESDVVGYKVPRHNFIFGKLTLGAGWYPDYQTRLLRVGKARYDPAKVVHEVVILEGAEGTLTHPLIHHNYRDVAQFHAKQQRYSAYDARILYQQGIHPKPQNYILQPLRHFWWRFVTLKGYRVGLHGLHLSLLMAWYEFRKYRLLSEMWKKRATSQMPRV